MRKANGRLVHGVTEQLLRQPPAARFDLCLGQALFFCPISRRSWRLSMMYLLCTGKTARSIGSGRSFQSEQRLHAEHRVVVLRQEVQQLFGIFRDVSSPTISAKLSIPYSSLADSLSLSRI